PGMVSAGARAGVYRRIATLEKAGIGLRQGIERLSGQGGAGAELAAWVKLSLASAARGGSAEVTLQDSAGHRYQGGAEIRDGDDVRRHEPTPAGQVISAETAAQMTAMATVAVQQEVQEALVEGYTVAGKTGTAQIAEPFGYHPTDVIGSFIGWLPADDPQMIVFVKLDRPTSAPWGSMTAAPVFSKLAKELVVLLDIPPDAIRLQANSGMGGG
nr:penicillin-binding transpeptidase domain-containing protein [Promineifilum sp.]